MQPLVDALQARFPQLRFTPGKTFLWSPETKEVFYKAENQKSKIKNRDSWSLLHETGHALLGHTVYKADIQLIKLELAAWEKAKELGAEFDIVIDEEHIQDCLDTYRDWLYSRSICPTCSAKCLQQNDISHYRCFNCHTVWKVTTSRFARPYRAVKNTRKPPMVFDAMGGF